MARILTTPKRGMYALVLSRVSRFDADGNYEGHEEAVRLEPVGSVRKGGLEIRTPSRRLTAEEASRLLIRGQRVSGGRISDALGFLAPDDPAVARWPKYEWGDYATVLVRQLFDAELAAEVQETLGKRRPG